MRIYAYGTTIRVWYSNSYHMSIANLHGSYTYNIKHAEDFCTAIPIDYAGCFHFLSGRGKGLVSDTRLAVSVQ